MRVTPVVLVMETRHKIFIRNVAEGTTEQEITELFRPYCRVVEATVLYGWPQPKYECQIT